MIQYKCDACGKEAVPAETYGLLADQGTLGYRDSFLRHHDEENGIVLELHITTPTHTCGECVFKAVRDMLTDRSPNAPTDSSAGTSQGVRSLSPAPSVQEPGADVGGQAQS